MVPANVLLSEQKVFGSFFQKRTAFFRLRLLEEAGFCFPLTMLNPA
jgi:hypothetical protein